MAVCPIRDMQLRQKNQRQLLRKTLLFMRLLITKIGLRKSLLSLFMGLLIGHFQGVLNDLQDAIFSIPLEVSACGVAR